MSKPVSFATPRLLSSWVWLCMAFLYLPLLVMMAFSFNDSKYAAVWRGFSLRHYSAAWHNEGLLSAFGNSLLLAAVSATLATVLGIMAAVALERVRLPWHRAQTTILLMPLVIPEVCLGIALLSFFHAVGWPLDLAWPWSLGTVLVAHVTFSLPFCTIVIRTRLRMANREVELAAHDLGANAMQAFWSVTLPQLRPALLASALLGFTLSLDDFVVTFFTAGADSALLPVKVFSMVKFGATPQVNAASTVLILITVVAVLLASVAYRGRKA